MTSERAPQVLGAGLATLCLVTLVVIDLAIPRDTVVLVWANGADPDDVVRLLDLPEVWSKSPIVENATPYTVIETTEKKLRVLPEQGPWPALAGMSRITGLI